MRLTLDLPEKLTPAPRDFGVAAAVELNSTVRCFSISTRPTPVFPLRSKSSVEVAISKEIMVYFSVEFGVHVRIYLLFTCLSVHPASLRSSRPK